MASQRPECELSACLPVRTDGRLATDAGMMWRCRVAALRAFAARLRWAMADGGTLKAVLGTDWSCLACTHGMGEAAWLNDAN